MRKSQRRRNTLRRTGTSLSELILIQGSGTKDSLLKDSKNEKLKFYVIINGVPIILLNKIHKEIRR